MHKLLNDVWEYEPESLEDVTARYCGFGCKLFEIISAELPEHYLKLKFYRSKSHQIEDVFCVCEGLGQDYGIQLDPDCEVICLWDEATHIEIGYWSEDEYIESIDFIRSNFAKGIA